MKKNFRKFTAMLIAVVMLIGILPAIGVSAATTTVTTAANTIKGFVYEEQGTLSYSGEHAYSGAKSLKIVAEDNVNTFVLLAKNYFKGGATYNFEYCMYVKSANDIYTRVNWDNTNGYNTKIYESSEWRTTGTNAIKVESVGKGSVGDGDWYRVTGTNIALDSTPSDDAQGLFSFVGGAEVYVDDLKITCTTPGYFVPSNPSTGFEDFAEGTQSFPGSFDKFSEITVTTATKVTDDFTVEYSNKAYDGSRSMHINTMRTVYSGVNNNLFFGRSSDFGLTEGRTYVMKFYIYPVNFGAGSNMWISMGRNDRLFVSADNNHIKGNRGTFKRIESGSKEGWYEYTSANTIYSINGWDPQFIVIENGGAEFYMDDITFTDVETGEVVSKVDFEKEYALPKNILTTQVSSDTLSVSWRNPKSSEVTKIALYDVNTNTLLAENFDTSSDKVQEHKTTEYAQNDSQIYRLDFTFNDGVVKSYTTGYTPGKSWSYKIGTWEYVAGEPKAPAKMMADDKVFHDAAPSLRVFSNATAGQNNEASTTMIRLSVSGAKFSTDKKYQIEGYFKSNNQGYLYARPFNNTGNNYRIYDPICGNWNARFKTTTEWTKFTTDAITAKYAVPASDTDTVLQFSLIDSAEDFWLDDLTVYELDADGNPTGNNLVEGIGAIDAAEKPAELTAGEVTNSVNSAMLRWTAADDAAYVAVYDKAVGTDVPIAYVPAEMGYVELANLTGGNTYNFLLKAVNSEGRESANGVSATAQPLPEDLIVSDFTVNTSGGTANVSIDIKNNGMGDNFTAQLIVAVYEGEDILKNVKATGITKIAQTGASASPVTLTQSITVPTGCTLKVYLWDSLDSMKPIKPSRSY